MDINFCRACDVEIKGTLYSFGQHAPLCRDCCYELEALTLAAQKRANRPARELGFLGRLFTGLFGGRR